MKIFVSGPYSSERPVKVMWNVMDAIDVSLLLIEKGHAPFVPHLYHYVDQRAQYQLINLPYEFWTELDDTWLQCCDALFYIGPSPGADRELDRARELGLKIYYAMGEVPMATIEEEVNWQIILK